MLYQTPIYLPFLLVSLLVYWLVLRRQGQRTVFLAVASVGFFLMLGQGRVSLERALADVGGMLALSVAVFFWGRRLRQRPSTSAMVAGIVACLLPLVCFKYLLPSMHAPGSLAAWIAPLGISYYTFKHIHYLVESQRGQFGDVSLREYFAYICFFPMFAAGPIERLEPFRQQLHALQWSGARFSWGLERILLGAMKKFLLADLVLAAFMPPELLSSQGLNELPWYLVLFACFVKFLMTYCDFSGYTDMALGTARLFGIELMENFNFPLLRANLAEFWRAWHISLSGFARDYVYFPALGAWRMPGLALMATMVSIGLWHSGSPGWILWGLHHGLGLVVLARFHQAAPRYPRLQQLRLTAPWRAAARCATLAYVSLGYALTFHPAHISSSLQTYFHIVSFGAFA